MIQGRQIQRSGEGSQQLQIAGDFIFNAGITEERAHEIALSAAEVVVKQFASESTAVLNARLDELDQRVIPLLSAQDSLNSFADPGFIRSYRKAQEGAASSERPADYDTLAALIADRAKSARDRPKIVGIDGAIDVVDRIHEDALRALTLVNAIEQWSVTGAFVMPAIELIEKIFETLVDGPLPTGIDWLDHLDVLNVLRRNTLSEMNRLEEVYAQLWIGAIAPGVEGESNGEASSLSSALSDLLASEGWPVLIVPHELKPGFFRVGAMNKSDLEVTVKMARKSDEYLSSVISLAENEFGFGQRDETAYSELMTRLRAVESISAVMDWWNSSARNGYYITPIGRALARANAFRLDTGNRLPRD